jgi:hypothetical protein
MVYILAPGGTTSPEEFGKILKLLMADESGKWTEPLAADELLEMGREAFEPLFHAPPLGPIPEHLNSHRSVHGCVAEYEEKLEELDRWKAQKLDSWLKGEVGKKFTVGEKVYELSGERDEPRAPDRYWLKPV